MENSSRLPNIQSPLSSKSLNKTNTQQNTIVIKSSHRFSIIYINPRPQGRFPPSQASHAFRFISLVLFFIIISIRTLRTLAFFVVPILHVLIRCLFPDDERTQSRQSYIPSCLSLKNIPENSKLANIIAKVTQKPQSSNNLIDPEEPVQDNLNITSGSVTIYDAKNYQVLYHENGRCTREMASLTKIMTCYIICLKLQKHDLQTHQTIQVSKQASYQIGKKPLTVFFCTAVRSSKRI